MVSRLRFGVRALVWAGVICGGFAFGVGAWAQNETTLSSGCTMKNDVYTCDQAKFQAVLANAKTAAIETGITDAIAQEQLKKLIAAAGKTLVGQNDHPDITFLLSPADMSGVQYTANLGVLGSMRVFAANPAKAGRGDLVWVENFTSEADTPWSLVVSRLMSQFRKRFHVKG